MRAQPSFQSQIEWLSLESFFLLIGKINRIKYFLFFTYVFVLLKTTPNGMDFKG